MSNLFLERSIPELLQGLESGRFSIADFFQATAGAIKAHEADTLAWVCYDLEQLSHASLLADEKYRSRGGLAGLDGLPFGVKDIFNTAVFPTQMGSSLWKNHAAGNDARAVATLMFAGALVAGKTVTAEFAVHALNETLNPHDHSRTPGTSSSGSAAAVATGMVPFALGTQTAGSIVRPASFCGVWGMKPSFGMIPRTGVLKTTDSLDTVGFLSAHAASLRPLLDQLRVKGPNYPFVYKNVDARGARPKPDGTPWRVGFVKTHTWLDAQTYAQQAVAELAAKIGAEPGFCLNEIAWPDDLKESHAVHATIYNKSLAYYFQNERKTSVQLTPVMLSMIAAGESISAKTFQVALHRQELICERLDQLFEDYDFILSMGTSSDAPPRGEEELPDPSLIWTLGHVPAIAAPAFRSPGGLPFGPQFVSRKWNDYLLLQGIEELVQLGLLPPGSQEIKRPH